MTLARRWALFPLAIAILASLPAGAAPGAPLGLPPLPPDPLLAQVAPDECLFYLAVNGSGEADAASASQTEQLLAEKEIQDLVKAIEVEGVKLRQLPLPSGGPPVYWGVHGQHVVVAVSQPAAELIVAGLQGRHSQPAWLARIRKTLAVERPATLAYVNVRGIQQLTAPFAGREAARVLGGLGISSVKSLSFVSGLEGEGLLSLGWLETDGEPKGLLSLAPPPIRRPRAGGVLLVHYPLYSANPNAHVRVGPAQRRPRDPPPFLAISPSLPRSLPTQRRKSRGRRLHE